MIVPGQMVEVKWGTRNKDHYIKLGYEFTAFGEPLRVKAEHIPERVNIEIEVYCEKCNAVFGISRYQYTRKLRVKQNIHCNKCRYEKQGKSMLVKAIHLDVKEIHRKVMSGELEKFPTSFFTVITEDEAIGLTKDMIRYYFKNGTFKSIDEVPKKISRDLFYDYKILRLAELFGLHNLAFHALDEKFNLWEFYRLPKNFWNKYKNRSDAFNWFVSELTRKGTIKSVKDLPNVKKLHEVFIEHNLTGLVNYYDRKISSLILDLCPNTFKVWELNVEKGFYQDEKNKVEIMNQFIEILFNDGVIETIDDIPKVAKRELFEHYKLGSFLTHCFNLSPYSAFDYMFPKKWKRWEFCHVPNNFWDNPLNLRNCLIWFVEKLKEDRLIADVKDLNDLNLSKLITEYGIATLNGKYDVPFMLSMIYGDEFKYDNYLNRISVKDGAKLDSISEVTIHSTLISNIENVKKPTMNIRFDFINHEEHETYVPDWIINDNIIVEYFGLYTTKTESEYIDRYTKKANRKIKYYKSLQNYEFIDLYPSDLQNNYEGLIKKFAEKGIEIKV